MARMMWEETSRACLKGDTCGCCASLWSVRSQLSHTARSCRISEEEIWKCLWDKLDSKKEDVCEVFGGGEQCEAEHMQMNQEVSISVSLWWTVKESEPTLPSTLGMKQCCF